MQMYRVSMSIVGLLAFCWLAACSSSNDIDDQLWLEVGDVGSEPCAFVFGSGVDPCEVRESWDNAGQASYSEEALPGRPFNMYDELKRLADYCLSFCMPQIYVRATVIPQSTRCAKNDAFIFEEDDGSLSLPYFNAETDSFWTWNCYVDLLVHEYFNGEGPHSFPIVVGHQSALSSVTNVLPSRFKNMEGYEYVFSLQRPLNVLNGEWSSTLANRWDIQRTDHGAVVVSWWTNVESDRDDLIFTLEDFREMTHNAMSRYYTETKGRLGTRGQNPYAARDGSRDALYGMLKELGAYSVADVTPVVAPPAPGQGDPNPDGENVLDETATASPEIPGGLEETETPGPLADDAVTATVTNEPTATETAEAETTVTPEPAPTPEQVATPTPESEVAPTATPEPAPTPEPDPTATSTPESVAEPTATATPEPVIEPTATPEPVPTDTATPEPEPVVDPTATPEDAVVPTDTPEPEVPVQEGPGSTEGPGGEGPDEPGSGTPGDNGPGAGPDG